MPVSVVVGGQYGSEGKGKVALELVRRNPLIKVVVRPGGTNSGHTVYTKEGRRVILRQLPASAIDKDATVVIPAGSYIDVELFFRELSLTGLSNDQVIIDPRAHVIRAEHVQWERDADLVGNIGSTGSGTGAAVLSRLSRFAPSLPKGTQAAEVSDLSPFVRDVGAVCQQALADGYRILIEGTQGFGLSPLHGDAWPKCTSRDTTAAAFLSEAGLSPIHVDEIVLVLRCHPIRVAGDSGPLLGETTWESIQQSSGSPRPLHEYTSVTGRLRRVGLFDPAIVRRAIWTNQPTRIVLNHLDYVDGSLANRSELSRPAAQFIREVERTVGHKITDFGTGPSHLASINAHLESVQ